MSSTKKYHTIIMPTSRQRSTSRLSQPDDDAATTITLTRGLKKQYEILCTKNDTYEDILTEALIALREKRKKQKLLS